MSSAQRCSWLVTSFFIFVYIFGQNQCCQINIDVKIQNSIFNCIHIAALKIWGSENLELSLKVWMCGGRVQTNPCSRVGHLFRKFSKVESDLIYHNKVRVAEVWMDEFKHLFYHRKGPRDDHLLDSIKMGASPDRVKDRKNLRSRLQVSPNQRYTCSKQSK